MRRQVMAFRLADRVGQEPIAVPIGSRPEGDRLRENVGENLLTVPLGVE